MKQRRKVEIDRDTGMIYIDGKEVTGEEWEEIFWKSEHFCGKELNAEAVRRNYEVIKLLRKLKGNESIADINIGSIKKNGTCVIHQLHYLTLVHFDEEGDDLNTLKELTTLCDEISFGAILHDEDTAEGLEMYNGYVNFIIKNIWKTHTYK